MLFLFCCVKVVKDDEKSIKLSTASDILKADDATESKTNSIPDKNSVTTSANAEKSTDARVCTKSQLTKSELIKIKPSTAFLSFFKLDQVPVVKKYKYDNLELLYKLEQYVSNRLSNKIEKYYEQNRDSIVASLDKTVFLGNTSVDNFHKKYNLLSKQNVYGMPDKSINEQLNEIDKYDFSKVDKVVICNGITSKSLTDKDQYVSVLDKLCDSIRSKNSNVKLFICSLLPASTISIEPYDIEKCNEYNLKSIEINYLLSEHFKDSYIDISFLVEPGDYEYDGSISKKFSMKIISFLTYYLEVKEKIIDAPLPEKKEIEYKEPEGKNIYMTFDDGPSENGKWLLSILEKYNVKVTMFYTGNSAESRQNIIDFSDANQEIAAHTFTHNFKVYESEEKYFDDLYKIESLLKTLTGKFTRIVRFPGGSANSASTKYSIGIMKKLVEDFKMMGYTYYDWNVSSGDGSTNITSEQILQNAKNGVKKHDNSVVLFHETHDYTVAVIEEFIKWAIDEGYEFKVLDYDTLKCHQSYSKLN